MGIIGIGTDIVHAPRIASLIARRTPAKLATRILSPKERCEWEKLSPPISSAAISATLWDLDAVMAERWFRFLTVRWAVKEAAYKALSPFYRPTWKEFTVSKTPEDYGKPSLKFKNSARVKLHVSISHDGEYTVASVLAEGRVSSAHTSLPGELPRTGPLLSVSATPTPASAIESCGVTTRT